MSALAPRCNQLWVYLAGCHWPFSVKFLFRKSRSVILFITRNLFRFSESLGGPVGGFSVLQGLRAGKQEGKVLWESQPLPIIQPPSVMLECGMQQEGNQPWPLFWTRHSDARLVGSSLCLVDEQKRMMIESAYDNAHYRGDPSFNYIRLPPPLFLKGPWTSIVSRWDYNYYHWFLDALPRLGLLPNFPSNTQILARGPATAYQRATLAWLGITDRVHFVEKNHYRVEDYYYSGFTGMTGCLNPWNIRHLRALFLSHGTTNLSSPEKFYLVRKGKTRGIKNEEEVQEFFRNRNWAIVDTEAMGVTDQIALFSRAKQICSLHGAGLTNLLWSSPGTRVLELFANNYLNGVYEGISLLNRLRYQYRVFPGDHKHKIYVPLHILSAALEA